MKLASLVQASLVLIAASVIAACGRERVETPPGPEAPVEIEASVDRAVATTGDLITYRIRVERSPEYEVEIPEPGADIAGFRITDALRESSETPSGRVVEERVYELRADLVGSYVLPPVSVRYRPLDGTEPAESAVWESSSTSEIFVDVESVLPSDGEATDIRALKPIQRRQREVPWLWIAIGMTVLVLAVVLVLVLLRRRRERPEEVIAPHELAFSSLDALRTTDFDDPAAVRRFYFSISEVTRLYVEGRFGLNATDLTTEEIVAELPDLPELTASDNKNLCRFLISTDSVKFANHEPTSPEVEQIYEEALSFVEATKPVAEEPIAGEPVEVKPDEEIAA